MSNTQNGTKHREGLRHLLPIGVYCYIHFLIIQTITCIGEIICIERSFNENNREKDDSLPSKERLSVLEEDDYEERLYNEECWCAHEEHDSIDGVQDDGVPDFINEIPQGL